MAILCEPLASPLNPWPEIPDIEAYLYALRTRVRARPLQAIRLRSAFLLRSVEPDLASFTGQEASNLRRIGKRVVFVFPDERFLVAHLMIAAASSGPNRAPTFPVAADWPPSTSLTAGRS